MRTLAGFDAAAAAAEGRRREAGRFDGLLGKFPPGAALLLQQTIARMRDTLLEEYGGDEAKVRALLREFSQPNTGFRGVTPTSDRTKLALAVLGDFAHASGAGAEADPADLEVLLFGPAGVDGLKSRARLDKAGAQSAKTRRQEANDRHDEWCSAGRRLLGQGKGPHEVAGIVAGNAETLASGKKPSERRVRDVLVERGVIPGRKKTETS